MVIAFAAPGDAVFPEKPGRQEMNYVHVSLIRYGQFRLPVRPVIEFSE
jgi:hypothetical protein